jgi:hypothetical protein
LYLTLYDHRTVNQLAGLKPIKPSIKRGLFKGTKDQKPPSALKDVRI